MRISDWSSDVCSSDLLHTVILVPKGAHHAGILMTRTPYDATALTSHAQSGNLAAILDGYDNAPDVVVDGGYIRVVQDVRGKYGSEGEYRSEEHTSELQSLMRISYAVFCLTKKKLQQNT